MIVWSPCSFTLRWWCGRRNSHCRGTLDKSTRDIKKPSIRMHVQHQQKNHMPRYRWWIQIGLKLFCPRFVKILPHSQVNAMNHLPLRMELYCVQMLVQLVRNKSCTANQCVWRCVCVKFCRRIYRFEMGILYLHYYRIMNSSIPNDTTAFGKSVAQWIYIDGVEDS